MSLASREGPRLGALLKFLKDKDRSEAFWHKSLSSTSVVAHLSMASPPIAPAISSAALQMNPSTTVVADASQEAKFCTSTFSAAFAPFVFVLGVLMILKSNWANGLGVA